MTARRTEMARRIRSWISASTRSLAAVQDTSTSVVVERERKYLELR